MRVLRWVALIGAMTAAGCNSVASTIPIPEEWAESFDASGVRSIECTGLFETYRCDIDCTRGPLVVRYRETMLQPNFRVERDDAGVRVEGDFTLAGRSDASIASFIQARVHDVLYRLHHDR